MPHETRVMTADGRTNVDTRARNDSESTASSRRFRSSSGTSASDLPSSHSRSVATNACRSPRASASIVTGSTFACCRLVVPAVHVRVVLDVRAEQAGDEDRRPLDVRRLRERPLAGPQRGGRHVALDQGVHRPRTRPAAPGASPRGRRPPGRRDRAPPGSPSAAATTRAPPHSGSTSASTMSRGPRRPGRWGRHAAATWVTMESTAMARMLPRGVAGPYDPPHRPPMTDPAHQLE